MAVLTALATVVGAAAVARRGRRQLHRSATAPSSAFDHRRRRRDRCSRAAPWSPAWRPAQPPRPPTEPLVVPISPDDEGTPTPSRHGRLGSARESGCGSCGAEGAGLVDVDHAHLVAPDLLDILSRVDLVHRLDSSDHLGRGRGARPGSSCSAALGIVGAAFTTDSAEIDPGVRDGLVPLRAGPAGLDKDRSRSGATPTPVRRPGPEATNSSARTAPAPWRRC
ncbi:MAG: hypothetical protein R2705_01020 [Ilumatobacteraceae bacterium]